MLMTAPSRLTARVNTAAKSLRKWRSCQGIFASTRRHYASAPEYTANEKIIVEELNRKRSPTGDWLKWSSRGEARGLFGHPALEHPEGFELVTRAAEARVSVLVGRILHLAPMEGEEEEDYFIRAVRLVDRLSDVLCQVVDLAECVRTLHPAQRWVEAATLASVPLLEKMNELNTSTEMYTVLKEAQVALLKSGKPLKDEKSVNAAHNVANAFLSDFEMHGVGKGPAERSAIIELANQGSALGRIVMDNALSFQPGFVNLSMDELKVGFWTEETVKSYLGAPKPKSLLGRGAAKGDYSIMVFSQQGQTLLFTHPNESVREKVWKAMQEVPDQHKRALERMLVTRNNMAHLVDEPNWAALNLKHKMAQTPENVTRFLDGISNNIKPMASDIKAKLYSIKHWPQVSLPQRDDVMLWDRDFCRYYLNSTITPGPDVSAFFSIGTLVAGLSRVFSRLYGVRFELVNVDSSEVWHPTIRKLNVIDDMQGLVGSFYLDLFDRPGKPGGASHVTVRCSRRVDLDSTDDLDDLAVGSEATNGSHPESFMLFPRESVDRPGHPGTYQLPLLVLVCAFRGSAARDDVALLDFQEVESFVHEMGHAMHSIFARTEFQNVSGTRCAADFVELPSIIMEHFLTTPEVIEQVARHHVTGQELPFSNIQQIVNANQYFDALDSNGQLLMAAIDQRYHGDLDLQNGRVDVSALARETFEKYSVFPYSDGSLWQTQFTHLIGYGSVYYSYLFDRAIASRVFQRLFAHDPLNAESGAKFKDGILSWGGSRNPWELLAHVLDEPELAHGGPEAMARVGSWGLISSKDGK